ncbi:MAG: helix-hairpin-helix domain-containing protein [Gammaproteobacteria bacterium]|nr:helix-hairpin-helix domain-containing protein [Gammaproteobacteria bacterium]MCY4254749.1 helix-hairpin-helix domain-containing protein [Gammaproteobacteria bacterium]MCY4341843.1 helix-hairpin-helix domain-containing protein [Gammaproteobacteria bacterium]
MAGEVNVNTADAETLAAELNGIGPVKAKAIIEYREQNGPFKSVEELLKVKGIGPKTLEKIRKDVLLDKASEPEKPTGPPPAPDADA